MSGGSGSGESFQTSQNIGTAFLANLFGQGVGFNEEGMRFREGPDQGGPRGSALGGIDTFGSSGGNFGSPFNSFGPQGTGTQSYWVDNSGNYGQGVNKPSDVLGRDYSYLSGSQQNLTDPTGLGSIARGGFAPQIFQPADFLGLRNMLAPTGRNILQELAGPIGMLGAEGLGGIVDSSQNALTQGLDSGFRTDMQPIIEAEKRRFSRETVPGLMEQYAGLTGGFSSATSSGLANAASDLGISLGSQQAQFDEAASNRRLQSMSVAPSIAGMPFGLGSQALGLGSQIQEDQYLSRPEIQLMRTLSNLFSFSPPSSGGSGSSSSKQGGI